MHRGLVLAALLPTCIVASCAKASGDLETGMVSSVSAGMQQEIPKQAAAPGPQHRVELGEKEDAASRAYRIEVQRRNLKPPETAVRSSEEVSSADVDGDSSSKVAVAMGTDVNVDDEPHATGTVPANSAATDMKMAGTIEPEATAVGTIPAEQLAGGAKGQHELPVEQTEAGVPPAATTRSPANAVMNAMIREAVCGNDESALQSVKTVIDAGILDKNAAIAAVDASIRMCMTAGGAASKFLQSLAGNDISIPYWMDAPGYLHGDANDLRFGHALLKQEGSFRFLVTGTYPQTVMMTSFGTSNQTYFRDDPAFTNLAPAAVNRRDCLGFTPLFYASSMGNFDFLKWLLDNGADPNIPVPFTTGGPGTLDEAVGQSNNDSKAYGLLPRYGCIDNGPSAALMESYRANDELVPVWIYALRQVNAASGKANFKIVAEMLAKVPSVPPTTLADVMDSKSWEVDVNAEEDIAMIKLLAEKGADLNAPLRDGRKPMASWIQQGINTESLRQLMFIGARL